MVRTATSVSDPSLTKDRPATIDDILRLGEMIQRSQQEMARYIVDGLRRNHPQSQSRNTSNYDTGNEGDIEDEDEEDDQGTGRERRRKGRTPWENLLSVMFPSFLPLFSFLTGRVGEDSDTYEPSDESPGGESRYQERHRELRSLLWTLLSRRKLSAPLCRDTM